MTDWDTDSENNGNTTDTQVSDNTRSWSVSETDIIVNFFENDSPFNYQAPGGMSDTFAAISEGFAGEETRALSEYLTEEYLAEAMNDPGFDIHDPYCIYDPADDAYKVDDELTDYEFEQKYGYFYGYTQDFGRTHTTGSDSEEE